MSQAFDKYIGGNIRLAKKGRLCYSLSYHLMTVLACGLVKANGLLTKHFKAWVCFFLISHSMLGQMQARL